MTPSLTAVTLVMGATDTLMTTGDLLTRSHRPSDLLQDLTRALPT